MKRSRWSKAYRHYEGAKPGLFLARWLNEPSTGAKLVLDLLTDAQLVFGWLGKYNSIHALNVARKKKKLPDEFWEAYHRLNNTLASLTHAPHIHLDEVGEGERLSWMWVTDESPTALVSVPIRCILQLIDRDAVTRVRKCAHVDCAKWFFAGRSDQEFCSALCRWRAFAGTDAFREKRREYQRTLYKLKKAGKVKIK